MAISMLHLTSPLVRAEPARYGCFFRLRAGAPFSEQSFTLGELPRLRRFAACRRTNTCFASPAFGDQPEQLPPQTQNLLAYDGARYLLLYALTDDTAHASLSGCAGGLALLVETGAEDVRIDQALCLYAIEGVDPHRLAGLAALELRETLGHCTLRGEKPVPSFVDDLGFCTYNAFYSDVSQDKLERMAREFRDGGVQLGFLLLDEGWQQRRGAYMTGFDADRTKFPGGLAGLAERLKGELGVRALLVWHAFYGYWLGVLPEAFPSYAAALRRFVLSPRNLAGLAAEPDGAVHKDGADFYPMNLVDQPAGVLEQTDVGRFFDAFYACLRQAGVDGVKIDALGWAECFGAGRGGRVRFLRSFLQAIESASVRHFHGAHIACSSNANDFLFSQQAAAVTRTSGDFQPDDPASHGLHILTNAHNAFWMQAFTLPDWDMFQSDHPTGEFHAMARAVSGGPVYVADEPGRHDFALLRRLCTADGRLGRPVEPARIAARSLLVDPAREDQPILVFAENRFGRVLGAFNCGTRPVAGSVSLLDADVHEGDWFVWSERRGSLGVRAAAETWTVELEPLQADLFTCAPVEWGLAPVGLTDKYNPQGFVRDYRRSAKEAALTLAEPGALLLYAERAPADCSATFRYEAAARLLWIEADGDSVRLTW